MLPARLDASVAQPVEDHPFFKSFASEEGPVAVADNEKHWAALQMRLAEPLPVDEPAAVWEQQTLDLDPVSKGIMERTTPVIWNNEDLDEPTYKRRKLMIDDGRKSPGKRR